MENRKFIIVLALLGGAIVLGYGLWPTAPGPQPVSAQSSADQTRNSVTGSEPAQDSARQTTLRAMPAQPATEASAPTPHPTAQTSLPPAVDTFRRVGSDRAGSRTPAAGHTQATQIALESSAAIDTDLATDLLVDQIAALQAQGPQSGDTGPSVWALRRRFASEKADPEWAAQATAAVHDAIDAWYAGLPEKVRYHLALIAVDCRTSLCEILAVADDPDSAGDRINAGQDWQFVAKTWPQATWWSGLGFVDITTQTRTRDGYLLYMIYLARRAR